MESLTMARLISAAHSMRSDFLTSADLTLRTFDGIASPLAGRPTGTDASGLCAAETATPARGECASVEDLRRHGTSTGAALLFMFFMALAFLAACLGDFPLPFWLLGFFLVAWVVVRTIAKTDLAILDCQWAALIDTPEEAIRRPPGTLAQPASNQTCSAMPPPGEPGSRMTTVYTAETVLTIFSCGWVCAFFNQVVLLASGLKARGGTELTLFAFALASFIPALHWAAAFGREYATARAAQVAASGATARCPRGRR